MRLSTLPLLLQGFFGAYFSTASAAGPFIFDHNLLFHPRWDAMGDAGAPLADGIAAPSLNPAGSGGLHWESSPGLGRLSFPLPSIGGYSSDSDLYNSNEVGDILFQPNLTEKPEFLTTAPTDAAQIRRHIHLSLNIKRLQLSYFRDEQLILLRGEHLLEESSTPDDAWQFWYGRTTGQAASLALPLGQDFNIGVSSINLTQDITAREFAGDEELLAAEDLLSQGTRSFTGTSLNFSLVYRPVLRKKFVTPALSLVVRDMGGTELEPDTPPDQLVLTGPFVYEEESLIRRQNTILGLALSPPAAGGFLYTHITLTSSYLGEDEVPAKYKHRAGLEADFGEPGDGALLRLSAGFGYKDSGLAATLDLGLIGAAVSYRSYYLQDQKIERTSVLVYTDVADIGIAKGKKYVKPSSAFKVSNWVPKVFLN